PRRLGNGTLSHTRPHTHDGHLPSRLVGGRRRHRGTAKQLSNSPRTDRPSSHRAQPAIPTQQFHWRHDTTTARDAVEASLVRTFQGWQAHGILIWSRSNGVLSQGAQAVLSTRGYAAMTAKAALQSFSFERR